MSILRNKKLLIPIIAVLFIPVLYTGMFLGAFWDPYARLDELPVAVVNMDKGASMEGEDIDLGNELVDKLDEGKEFNFIFVDEKEGDRGLENQKYYMTIKIPEDFSQNATTLLDEKPEKLELVYMPNESYNFLSSQIGGTAVEKIKASLSEKVSETYAETMFDKVGEMADGLGKANEGADKLNGGAGELKKGSKALYDNLEMLAGKSIEFSDGMNKAYQGTKELNNGASKLAGGLGQLQEGEQKLQTASGDLQAGQQGLNEGISKTKDGLQQVNGKMPELVNGTGKLKDGADQLQGGAGELKTGADTLKAGADQLQGGTAQLSTGASTLAGGLNEWQSKSIPVRDGAAKLDAGINQLNEQLTPLLNSPAIPAEQKQALKAALGELVIGSNGLKVGTSGLSEGAGKLYVGAAGLSKGADKLYAGAGELSEGAGKLSGGVDKLATGAEQLSGGLATVNDGQKQLQGGIGQLAEGSVMLQEGSGKLVAGQNQFHSGMSTFGEMFGTAKSGADQLASGSNTLVGGLGQLAAGSEAMQSGAGKLSEGAGKVADGNGKLADGSAELADKLKEGADKADIKAGKDNFNMMANPVKVDNEKINEVPNYGTGFAPYFLSLGLFVGALLISIVFPFKEPAGIPGSGFRWYTGKTAVLAGVGILQSLLADAILLLGLGLEVDNVPLFILFTIITSFTFLALIQFLVTLLGDPGRFIAILILIFQLTTSAGTFPLELIPGWLQVFNPLLPMTYSVSGFKAIVSSGDIGFMWQNAWTLLGYIAALSAGTLLYFKVMHKRTYYKAVNDK
ncbi:YhgE/Pip domain-containing protein [Mesobacillus zeae]|uniref:YhgE/Pip domain-containing protein n=1 Tax=Mesobacillus zeae TaxID=1917180 RepID=UPI0028709441|nr:YhgE/Pip domain-containing protein [Mesobacillus zeae]